MFVIFLDLSGSYLSVDIIIVFKLYTYVLCLSK